MANFWTIVLLIYIDIMKIWIELTAANVATTRPNVNAICTIDGA